MQKLLQSWTSRGRISRFFSLCLVLPMTSCVTQTAKFATVPFVDINRYMGDWYVQGHTPVFFDHDSSDQVESYQLTKDGTIDTHYRFTKNGKQSHYNPQGSIYNKETNAHWKMQFLWPFSSDFLIVRLDTLYTYTVVSVPDKEQIWIMSRQRQLPAPLYQTIVDDLARDNYPVAKIRRVPQGTVPL